MTPGRRGNGWRRATFLTALALLGVLPGASPAVGAERSRQPSARELWQQYPLGRTGHGGARETVTPAPAAPLPSPPARASDPSGAAAIWVGLMVVLLIAVLGPWTLVRERRRRPAATGPPTERAEPARPVGVPPAPEQAWTAEVEWRDSGRQGAFCVVATPAGGGATATLAESPPLEWPPAGPSAVHAMTAAVDALEAPLLAAGWSALPPGDAWFAKRFAWEPLGVDARAGRRRRARAQGRFARSTSSGRARST